MMIILGTRIIKTGKAGYGGPACNPSTRRLRLGLQSETLSQKPQNQAPKNNNWWRCLHNHTLSFFKPIYFLKIFPGDWGKRLTGSSPAGLHSEALSQKKLTKSKNISKNRYISKLIKFLILMKMSVFLYLIMGIYSSFI
jgi:hypothetical protein